MTYIINNIDIYYIATEKEFKVYAAVNAI